MASEEARLLGTREELAPVEDEWRSFAEARGNPFLTPEWFRSAIDNYDATPAVIAVSDDGGALRGVLPLARQPEEPRRLRFPAPGLSDWIGLACAPGDEEEVAAAAARALDLKGMGCTTVVLDNVDAEPQWWDAMAGRGTGTVARRLKRTVLPVVETKGISWEQYLNEKSSNFRRDVRRKLARLEREHAVEFRCTADARELERDLGALHRLHDARWSDGSSTAAGEQARGVISEFAAAALERGWLRLWTLWLDGEPAAGLMQFLLGGRLSSYYTGFDPRLQREGAGFVLTAHTLRAAIEEEATEFNMLMGDESWKQRFSTGSRPITTVALVRARHPARIVVGAESAGRRALERLGPEGRERIVSLARPLTRRLPSAWKN